MMKKMRKIKILQIVSILFLFSACNFKDNNSINFENWEKKQFNKSFIKLINQKAIFYDGIPNDENFMSGKLEEENDKVYFKSNKIKYILFDFTLPIDSCIKISYKKSPVLRKNYFLCKQDEFFDQSRKDSIYKFCFKNYQVFNENNGIVYFVSKSNGILGCYLVDYSNSNKDPMINKIMYGEVFTKRYNYEKLPRFTIK